MNGSNLSYKGVLLMKDDLSYISKTALLTLYVRAKDYESNRSVLHDEQSWRAYRQIKPTEDLFSVHKGWKSYYGILGRARVFDQEITKFINQYHNAIIVSLGSGLDTEFYRVDNGHIDWYNIDFPDVIKIREELFEEHPRVHNIGASILDQTWIKEIKRDNRPLLFISEGVLMYLSESDVQKFLYILTDYFKGSTAYFDFVYRGLVGRVKHHDILRDMSVEFTFGVKDGSEICTLNPNIRQIGFINFTSSMMSLVPGVKKIMYPIIYLLNNRMGQYEI